MRYLLLIMAIAMLAVTSAHARKQSTTRNVRHATTALLQVGPSRDTIAVTGTAVRLSGYDKPLRATRESMFVTSSLDDTIRALRVHSRDVDITADIPPADTRCVDFKSRDTQKSFYYHLGPKPRRGTATPYKVEAHVVYVITDSQKR